MANWQGRVVALVATPWYGAPPWPQVIASSMARRQGLPLPIPYLAEEAFEGVGRNWYPEYVAGKVQHKPLADQRGRELPPLGGYSRS